jgi:hypothetical protein
MTSSHRNCIDGIPPLGLKEEDEFLMNARRLTLSTVAVLCALASALILACAPALAVKGYVPAEAFGSAGAINTPSIGGSGGDVSIFDDVSPAAAITELASPVSETAETVAGTITPEGEAITECSFEYGTEVSYGQGIPCAQTPAEINALSAGGTVSVKVSAEITGLKPLTTYDFRLNAADASGDELGGNETFYTFGRPAFQGEAISNLGSTEASFSAQVDPGGEVTGYRLQYGSGSVEEHSTPEVSVGSARSFVNVSVSLSGLQAGTAYHTRLVAANHSGSATGEELSFATNKAQEVNVSDQASCPNRTFAGFSTALPDCRAYELVSDDIDEAYVPDYNEPSSEGSGTGEVVGTHSGDVSLFQAAINGEGLAYAGGE